MIVFESTGKSNTKATLACAVEEAIRRSAPLVVSSTSGNTALAALSMLREHDKAELLCVVSHVFGSPVPGENRMAIEARQTLVEAGVPVVTAAHALSGAERSLSTRMQGVYPVEIIAHTLRMFSQGVKVAVEIGAMALDAGAIPAGVPIVAVGGSVNGADTALLLTPENTHDILGTQIHEILCKPFGRT